MGFVWVHVESFLHSVASPFHSFVTTSPEANSAAPCASGLCESAGNTPAPAAMPWSPRRVMAVFLQLHTYSFRLPLSKPLAVFEQSW